MRPGTYVMLRWCADRWAVVGHCQHQEWPTLDRELDPSGWMMSDVEAMKPVSVSVDTEGLEATTVVTVRMLVSSVKVNKPF